MEQPSYTEKCGPHENNLLAKLTKVNLTWNNIYKQIFLKETGNISAKSKLHKQEKKRMETFPIWDSMEPKFCIPKAVTQELRADTMWKKNKNAIFDKYTPSTRKQFFHINAPIFLHLVVKTIFSP